MGTIVYNNTSPDNFSSYDAIGQVAESGIVYTSPFSISATTAIGQVYDDGIVYNRLNAKSWEFAVGHVNDSGVIYSSATTEYNDDAIGHVNSRGIVYRTPFSEYNADIVGHVDGPDKRAAAAAFLLLLSNQSYSTSPNHAPAKENYTPGLTSDIVGFFSDIGFRVYNKVHGLHQPCKICGKKLDPKDYVEQDGYCLRCYTKELTKKQTGQPASTVKYKPTSTVKPKPATKVKPNPPASVGQVQSKTAPQKQSDSIWGKNLKFMKCPVCGTRFKVVFPVGVRNMEKACPNCRTNLICEF